MLLYEVLLDALREFDDDYFMTCESIVKDEVTYPYHSEVNSLIGGMLTKDPQQRIASGPHGFLEIISHPWFEEIDWVNLARRECTPPWVPPSDLDEGEASMYDIYSGDEKGSDTASNNDFEWYVNHFDLFAIESG